MSYTFLLEPDPFRIRSVIASHGFKETYFFSKLPQVSRPATWVSKTDERHRISSFWAIRHHETEAWRTFEALVEIPAQLWDRDAFWQREAYVPKLGIPFKVLGLLLLGTSVFLYLNGFSDLIPGMIVAGIFIAGILSIWKSRLKARNQENRMKITGAQEEKIQRLDTGLDRLPFETKVLSIGQTGEMLSVLIRIAGDEGEKNQKAHDFFDKFRSGPEAAPEVRMILETVQLTFKDSR